jgi:hypothetical protein
MINKKEVKKFNQKEKCQFQKIPYEKIIYLLYNQKYNLIFIQISIFILFIY